MTDIGMITNMKRIKTIRIATRQSKLALWQSNFVKFELEKIYPHLHIELVGITTEGDQQQSIPLSQIGGKTNFVKALQDALLKNEADIAVHSIKDMSVFPVEKLILAAICERANPRDAFISNHHLDIFSLPENAIVGTASPRRTCLIKSMRPDLQITMLRGNVDTRLAKLDAGNYDAIILAAAGLERLGLKSCIRSYFSDEIFIPAIGQGAIGIECREDDIVMRDLLVPLHHQPTAQCVMAERAVNQVIGGDCHTAIGAYAKMFDHQMQLSGMLGDENTGHLVRARVIGSPDDAESMGKTVGSKLLSEASTLSA